VRNLYSFATKPDLALYFRVESDIALRRLLSARAKVKFYEAGMDLGISPDIGESFRIFQGRVIAEYDKIVDEYGLAVIDATRSIPEQQGIVRRLLHERLGFAFNGAGGTR
jgi:dTMP kinase